METAKFEFQKGRVTGAIPPNEVTVSQEMIGALKDYLDRTQDHLTVNWEFLDQVDRTK